MAHRVYTVAHLEPAHAMFEHVRQFQELVDGDGDKYYGGSMYYGKWSGLCERVRTLPPERARRCRALTRAGLALPPLLLPHQATGPCRAPGQSARGAGSGEVQEGGRKVDTRGTERERRRNRAGEPDRFFSLRGRSREGEYDTFFCAGTVPPMSGGARSSTTKRSVVFAPFIRAPL